MRIPTQTLPTVGPEANPSPNLSDGVRGIGLASATAVHHDAQGLQDLGKGFAAIADAGVSMQKKKDEAAAKARDQAATAQATDGVAQFQDYNTSEMHGDAASGRSFDVTTAPSGEPTAFNETTRQGFLHTRGAEASETSAATLERISKKRKELEDGLTTPEAKQLFRGHTQGIYDETRRKVSDHTFEQNMAQLQASAKNGQNASLRGLAADPIGPGAAQLIEQPVAATRKLSIDPSAAESEWRAQAAAAQVDSLLARGDWRNAEGVLKAAGPDFPPKVRKVAEDRIGDEKAKAQGSELGIAAVERSVNADKTIDIDKALEEVIKATEATTGKDGKEVPVDTQTRDVALRQAARLGREKNLQWKADTDRVKRAAGAQFNIGGFDSIPSALQEDLNARAPDYYRQLKNGEAAQLRLRQVHHRGGIGALDREQNRLNKLAWYDYMSRDPDKRVELDAATHYAGTGVDGIGIGAITAQQAKDRDRLKKHGQKENAFVQQVIQDAKGRRDVNGKASDPNTAGLKGLAAERYQSWVDEHEGKLPSDEEAGKLRTGLFARGLTAPRMGESLFGKGEEPLWKQQLREKQAASKGGGQPPKSQRVQGPPDAKGKRPTGSWDGKKPLPDGWTVIGG